MHVVWKLWLKPVWLFWVVPWQAKVSSPCLRYGATLDKMHKVFCQEKRNDPQAHAQLLLYSNGCWHKSTLKLFTDDLLQNENSSIQDASLFATSLWCGEWNTQRVLLRITGPKFARLNAEPQAEYNDLQGSLRGNKSCDATSKSGINWESGVKVFGDAQKRANTVIAPYPHRTLELTADILANTSKY